MATFVKHNQFVEDLAKKVHNLDADTLKIALVNADPASFDTYATLTNEVANGFGYTTGGSALSGVDAEQTAGVLKLDATDLSFVASGGSIGPFRYAVLYNDTAASKQVIGHWDYGEELTLDDADSVDLVIAGTGILTIT
ncbi:MAG: hypothetical protein AB7F22_07845 [Reyranella sp.]|uniref:hypothetical protein n=1 Tax=Reyranella sp. TaxID=1929291 RepID=UPI003D149294